MVAKIYGLLGSERLVRICVKTGARYTAQSLFSVSAVLLIPHNGDQALSGPVFSKTLG